MELAPVPPTYTAKVSQSQAEPKALGTGKDASTPPTLGLVQGMDGGQVIGAGPSTNLNHAQSLKKKNNLTLKNLKFLC